MNAKQKMVLLAYLRAHPWPTPQPKRMEEDAPALVRGAAGLALGGIAAAGTPALMGLFGPILGMGIGAVGSFNAAKLGMEGADAIWDWAAKKLGGGHNEKDFAFAHIKAASAGQDEFEYNNKTYPVTLKKNQIQPAIQAVKSVTESALNSQGLVEADQVKKVFTKNGKPVGEVGIDPDHSPGVGKWYMKCYDYDIDNSGYDSYQEAVQELKDCIRQMKESTAVDEAKYHGKEVSLGKPVRGGPKKFYVYVRDPSTKNIKKVNFGDPNMKIKKNNPARRKSFRARHKCSQKKDRTTAGFWSCRAWE